MTDTIDNAIPPPNYTQVPNLILDNIHLLSDVELRVMLVACRQTLGWHREKAPLSIGYLEAKTGKSKQGVRDGVKKSTSRKWLKKVGTGKRGVSIYGLNFSDLSTQLTGTSQPSRQEHINSVDTVKKDKESLKKKDFSAKIAEGSDSSKCDKCKYEYRWLFDANNTKHRVCNCTTDEDMRRSGFVEHPERENGDRCINCESIVTILYDDNSKRHDICKCNPLSTVDWIGYHPGNPKLTDMSQTEDLIKWQQRRNAPATPEQLAELKERWEQPLTPKSKSPITTDDKPKHLVTREQDEPIAQTPANLKTAPVETSQVMPEAAPEKAAKKAKTEKQIAHEEMQQAIIHALGVKQKNVVKWGPINTASKDLRTAGIHPDKLMGWRTWNTGKQYGIIKNAGGIPGSWPEYMQWREGRTFPTWEETKAMAVQTELEAQIEPDPELPPNPEQARKLRELVLEMCSGNIIGFNEEKRQQLLNKDSQ